jgi:hypothetical protein
VISPNSWPIRKVLIDLYEVREAVSPGRYSDEHLQTLSKSLRWVEKKFGLSKAKLARELHFSPSSVSAILVCERPRFANFMRFTNNLIAFLEDKVAASPEIPPVFEKGTSDWRKVKSDATKKIARLSKELSELLDIVRQSNSLSMNDKVFTPELKAQLIALLETALAQLKSPMVEISLLTKIGRWLSKLGKKVGEEEGEKILEKLATNAGEHMIDLVEGYVS